MSIPRAEQERRKETLESRHEQYDPEERLIKQYFGGEYNYNWYLRNAYAHPTRQSLSYAVDLLDTYDDAFLERAQDIIRRIIGIQEADPNHQHYGVWPHLMEEPLGAVTFATDGGGKHLSLDRLRDGTFEAEDFSLRFEFGGPAASAALPCPERLGEPIVLQFGDVSLGIHVPFAEFDDCEIHWETGCTEVSRAGDGAFLDVTFHRGENRVFKLPNVKQAAVAFALQVGGCGAFDPASATLQGETLSVVWGDLSLSIPVRPDTYEAMRKAVRGVEVRV